MLITLHKFKDVSIIKLKIQCDYKWLSWLSSFVTGIENEILTKIIIYLVG